MNNCIKYFKELPSKSILNLTSFYQNNTIPRYFVYYAIIHLNNLEDHDPENDYAKVIGWLYDSSNYNRNANESNNADTILEIHSNKLHIKMENSNIEIFAEEHILSNNNHKIYRSLNQSEFNEFCESGAKWLYKYSNHRFIKLDLSQFITNYQDICNSNCDRFVYYSYGREHNIIYCDQTDYNNAFLRSPS